MSPSLREKLGLGSKTAPEPLKPLVQPQTGLKTTNAKENDLRPAPGPETPVLTKEPAYTPYPGPSPTTEVFKPVKPEEPAMPKLKEDYDEDEDEEEEEIEEDDEDEDEDDDGHDGEDEDEEGNADGEGKTNEPVAPKGTISRAKESLEGVPDNSPGKFALRKLVKKPTLDKRTGKVSPKPIFVTLEKYDSAPQQNDVVSLYQPFYGGGEYLLIDLSTKKVARRYQVPGEEKQPYLEEAANSQVGVAPAPAPFFAPVAPVYAPAPTPAPAPAPPVKGDLIERVQSMKTAQSDKALAVLEKSLEMAMEQGNMDLADKILDKIAAIGNGGKAAQGVINDPMIQLLMAQLNAQQQAAQSAQQMMFQALTKTPSGNTMKESIEMMNAILGLSQKMGGGNGEDSSVAMAREVGGIVKDSMKDVTETLITVTGSGGLKGTEEPSKEVYRCQRCGNIVQPTWKVCPNCALVFRPGVIDQPAPQMRPNPVEVFETKAPKIPEEIKSKIGYLKNLAVFIQQKHDPEMKANALFKMCGPEERLALLFSAQFGYDNLLRLAGPYRNSSEIPDRDSIFKIVESTDGRVWIDRFFKAIKVAATNEGVYLTEADKEDYINRINEHSPVQFKFKPRGKPVIPGEKETPAPVQVGKSDDQKDSHVGEKKMMSKCPMCEALGKDTEVPVNELYQHLITEHPRPPKPKAEEGELRMLTPEELENVP